MVYDGSGMIVGREGVGRTVVDVAVLEARLAVGTEGAIAAGDLVAIDAMAVVLISPGLLLVVKAPLGMS
jgi:hypothetical protein